MQRVNIRVIVEGKNGNLYDNVVTVTTEKNGLDLLKTAVGEQNVEGSEGQYGFFITGILGEKGLTAENYATSWYVYIRKGDEISDSPVSISTLNIDNIDRLILHIGAYDPASYASLTFIPVFTSSTSKEGVLLNIKKIVTSYDADWKPIIKQESVDGAKVKILGKEYTTGSNGEILLKLKRGRYDVDIYKEGQNYPELIRSRYSINVDYESFNDDSNLYTLWKSGEMKAIKDKKWTIAFNYEVDDKLISDGIVVVDSENKLVPVSISKLSDPRKIEITGPENGYTPGSAYTLYIKNTLKSIDNKILKTSWKLPFVINIE